MARKKDTKHLYERDGVWYLRKRVDGKLIRMSLETGKLDEAIKKRDAELAIWAQKDKAARLRSMMHAADDAAQAAAVHERTIRDARLKISEVWARASTSPAWTIVSAPTNQQRKMWWDHFAAWAAAAWGDEVPIHEVDRRRILEYARHLVESGAASFNRRLIGLAQVWRSAQDGVDEFPNPFLAVPRQKTQRKRRRNLTMDELRKIVAIAEGECRAAFLIGAYTGYRLGDVCQLQWGQIDLASGWVRIVPGKTARKTGRAAPVPIHPTLRELLEATPPAARRGDVLPELAAKYRKDRAAPNKLLVRAIEAAGIVRQSTTGAKSRIPEVGFHSLRHMFTSELTASGAGRAEVQELRGDTTMTQQGTYTHVSSSALQAAVAALPTLDGRRPMTDAERLGMIRDVLAEGGDPAAMIERIEAAVGCR